LKYEVTIPIPPSVNQLYRNVAGKGRASTRKYRQWKADVTWLLINELPKLVAPVKIGVTIKGGTGFRRNSDISNRIKATEDALVAAGRLEDDNVQHVTEVRARYFPPEGKERATCILSIIDSAEGE